MSVLTVAQKVAKKIGVAVPDAVAANTNREIVELFEVMNDAAETIASGYDWRSLCKISTFTGDGSTEAFNFPADYRQMVEGSEIWSSSLETPLQHIKSLNEWLGMDVQSFDFVVNAFIIYGDQFHVKPALGTGVTAKMFYTSKYWAKANDATLKAEFTADDDTFVLNENLLRLATIWKWKESKGQAYAEAMADYEEMKARITKQDAGSRDFVIGGRRINKGIQTAYPTSIVVS